MCIEAGHSDGDVVNHVLFLYSAVSPSVLNLEAGQERRLLLGSDPNGWSLVVCVWRSCISFLLFISYAWMIEVLLTSAGLNISKVSQVH